MAYRLQMLGLSGQWQDMHTAPRATEEEAWQLLAAWERYCPRDRFRWVRNAPAAGLSFTIKGA